MSVKPSTLRLYEKEWQIFIHFCNSNSLSFLPASSDTVERFMSCHVDSRAMSTLPTVLSAISHFHSKFHHPSPTTSRSITKALEGAKRSFGKPSVSAKVFTSEHLTILSAVARKPSCSFIFLRTVWRIFIEFFGLLRFNEVANLRYDDLVWTHIGFNILIRKSKTDQHAKGDYISISRNINDILCPVSLTLLYLKRLNYTTGYLLPTLKGKVPDPDNPLSYSTALRDLRKCLSFVNIDPAGFGEHSGRRGGTTAAALSGASIDELMLQGRWRSSDMPRLYSDNASKLGEILLFAYLL